MIQHANFYPFAKLYEGGNQIQGVFFDASPTADSCLLVYSNDAAVARVSAPTIGSSATTLTNSVLSPVFQMTPTATDTLTVDYVLAAQEVTR